jgi:hypothetical protein
MSDERSRGESESLDLSTATAETGYEGALKRRRGFPAVAAYDE